ncbi:MAG: tetratricopeptide repeat-containing glycosyltransferase family protein [Verrucomicrobia bacterium]|nr:tetratricopeptide repeat-containing glycosyltransferase family protein [Verrucomicrobiota bacterium]
MKEASIGGSSDEKIPNNSPLESDRRDALLALAEAYSASGRLGDAETCLRRFVSDFPRCAAGHLKLGELLEEAGNLDAALVCADAAVRIEPEEFHGYFLKGSILVRLNRFPEAVLSFNHGVQLNPALADCIVGTLLGFKNEAVTICNESLRTNPADVDSLVKLAKFRYLEGRANESIVLLDRALQHRPGDPQAEYSLAFSQLLLGQFESGWRHYESRFRTGQSAFPIRSFSQPRWNGEDLNGRTILLHSEQGAGDTIQFVRYASLVENRGGRVLVECPRSVKRLVETHSSVLKVVALGDQLPQFDIQIPLLSLPSIFRTTLHTIPNNVPYLRVSNNAQIEVGRSVSGCLRIGLVWAGNPGLETDLIRSITLDRFSPFWDLPNVEYYSLQIGPAGRQLYLTDCRRKVKDLAPQLTDFALTASVIEQLDLIISVDTAVAHLAGALGKLVWLLLPFAPEWRWMLDREDSPWYPTMRLFRQSRQDDWTEVVLRVRDALRLLAASKDHDKP